MMDEQDMRRHDRRIGNRVLLNVIHEHLNNLHCLSNDEYNAITGIIIAVEKLMKVNDEMLKPADKVERE
jgi:hypothetical protein